MNGLPPARAAFSTPYVMQARPSSRPHPHARSLASIAGLSLLVLPAATQAADEAPTSLLGFTAARATEQQALEKRFDAQLNASDQRAWLQRMSAEPNHVGSPHNRANAEFLLEKFREWGWDAH